MARDLIAVLCAVATASVCFAAPEITVVDSDRSVDTGLSAGNGPDSFPSTRSAFRSIDGPTNGPWSDFLDEFLVGDSGALAAGFAHQQSNQTTFAIEGEGTVSSQAISLGPDAEGSANASTTVNYTITVPEDAPFSLTGEAVFEASGPDTNAGLSVVVLGTRPGGGFFFETDGVGSNDMDPANPYQFFISDTIQGGSQFQVAVTASSHSEGTSDGTISFEFVLDFGDTDRDGLLDVWETDGIDLDDDGVPEVVLAGANPMKKDLYVEIDAMSGVPVDTDALDDVVAVFATAPADMVDNPDGSAGINLHYVVSDTDLPAGDLPEFDAIDPLKNAWWGSQADRNSESAETIREARDKAYRYCLLAETLEGEDGPAGQAELPGNDFIIAVTTALSVPYNPRQTMASVFMHELGHNLNLGHGGQDNENYKPNYLSIMNYA